MALSRPVPEYNVEAMRAGDAIRAFTMDPSAGMGPNGVRVWGAEWATGVLGGGRVPSGKGGRIPFFFRGHVSPQEASVDRRLLGMEWEELVGRLSKTFVLEDFVTERDNDRYNAVRECCFIAEPGRAAAACSIRVVGLVVVRT